MAFVSLLPSYGRAAFQIRACCVGEDFRGAGGVVKEGEGLAGLDSG